MNSPDLPAQFARTHRFAFGVPRGFTVSRDGARVLFLRSAAGDDPVSRLWLYEGNTGNSNGADGADGTERMLADPLTLGGTGTGTSPLPEAELVRRERAREASQGVVAFAADDHARVVAFALSGTLWTVRTDGGAPRRIDTPGPVVDPRPSPDGSLVAYVTGGALRVVGADGTGDRALAEPEGDDVTYGLADHVAAESMGRHRAFWWSPDGDALLVARVNTARVRRWWLSDPSRPDRPPRSVPYPAAGTANAETTLHILRTDGSRVAVRTPEKVPEEYHPTDGAWTDTTLEYVLRARWDAYGPLVTLQTRDQRAAYILEVDPESGESRMVGHKRESPWLDLVPGTPVRLAGGKPVQHWHADRDTAGLRVGNVLTPPGLHVREVLATVGERVWFTASDEPTDVHVWSLSALDEDGEPGSPRTGEPERISEGPGVHTAAVGGDTVVLDSRTPDGHTVTVLRAGKPDGHIAVLSEEPVVKPAPRHLTLGERAVRGALFLPSWHTPGTGKLPVLLCPYSGPGIQLVVHARAWWTVVAQWFAEQGFAVLIADGRGTPGRGRGWEHAVYGDQLTPVLDDQVNALRAAAALHPDLDLGRVGIRGWSFGGYLAAGAVLRRPDVFHAAVAGAAPSDLRLYDTHWKERFLGHPGFQPEHYDRCSLLADAHRLARPLMLVHGLADDNVLPVHTLRLSAALLAAGRPHTVLPLPGASHLVDREDVAANLLNLELDFLQKSLNA
ncbi:prolyl oligopeptidase family serine peptidase [Streptomyces aurantiacus]|uniref:Putative prolyl tripeptidyl peptidase n=1 Tax=Streptomyces aurantiacus JA 4570 TaxID=1286094 RepID=S3ZTJ0_9ACTN|nr:prolyl oligopeptidase family serine peptidase [Streptomyces aurantiacus]EPH46751.1 putative prolyl tripeptidyl peptidase [Streptomyces aurantiacus JA 4570]